MVINLYKSRCFDPTSEAAGNAVFEREGDDIAREAYSELDGGEAPKKKEPEEAQAEPVERQPAEGQTEPPVKTGEDTTKTEEAPAGEKTQEEKDAEAAAAAKATEAPASEPIPEEKIQAFAEKHNVTFIQAREELEQSQALLLKYGNDPLELARATRNTQREYDRIKAEREKPVTEAPQQLLSDAELKSEIDAYSKQHADKIVEKYRQTYPKRTEVMDDETILEWAKDDATKNYKANAGTAIAEMRKTATDRRQALLDVVAKEDARFVHDVKIILENTADKVILNPKYNIKAALNLVRGERAPGDVKAAYDRGLKQGREEAKILGTVGGDNPGGKQGVKAGTATGNVSLSDDQKQCAYDQYPDSLPEKAIENFKDVYKEDLKKNPKYLPN